MTLKISIISKTFRVHDNPFLDSDLYIIYVDKKDYGPAQITLLHQLLCLHLKDLKKLQIDPILLDKLDLLKKFLLSLKQDFQIYVDHSYPHMKFPFKEVIFVPTWTLLDWTPHVSMLQDWFLPEGLKNHKNFKVFTHSNLRDEYESSNSQNKKIMGD